MNRRSTTAIIIEGIHDAALAARVYTRMTATLARVSPPPAVAKVIFADENGSKGGLDTRCTIAVHLPRRRDVSVTELGTSGSVAFDLAYTALDTGITREYDRRRELVRRPKKYYLAKRLLASDLPVETRQASVRAKRARRRRVA